MLGKKILLSASIALAITACSEQQTVDNYLAQADQATKENKVKESEIALKNAVKLDPKSSLARLKLGSFYLSQGLGDSAVKELEKAQSLKSTSDELIPALARAYVLTNDDDSVLALSEKGNALPKEQAVVYLSHKTLAAIRTSQPEIAKAAIEQAESLLAANPYTILAKAYLELVDEKIERADALVTKSLSQQPDNPEAVMFQGQVNTAKGDFLQASENYKHYLKLQPQSRVMLLVLADTLVKTDKYLEAEKYADIILKSIPNQPVANYVKAVVRFAEKDYKIAQQLAESGLNSDYQKGQLRLIAGASAFYQGNHEQVNAHLGSIIEYLKPEHAARKMYAVSQFHLGSIENISEALQGFTPTTEQDAEFLSSLSFNLHSIGATNEAKKVFSQSEETKTQSTESNTREAVLKVMMNDYSGVKDLEKSLQTDEKNVNVELAIAYAALKSGDYDKALQIAQKWLEKAPEKFESHNMIGVVYAQQGNTEKAIAAFTKSLELSPDNAFALTELTAVYGRNKNIEEAKKYADKALELYPSNIKALRNFYAVEKSAQALNKIKSAYQADNTNVALKVLYMEVLLSEKELKTLIDVANIDQLTIQTPKKIWQLIVVAYQRLQQGNDIKKTLDKWNKVNPYHVEPVLLIADYYAKTRDPKQALSTLNKALTNIHQDNVQLKLVKMQLLLDNRMVVDAKRLNKELQQADINSDIKIGIKGRIALLEGDFKQAEDNLALYYQAFPSSQNVMLLTAALQGNDKKPEAIKLIENHLGQYPKDNRAKSLLANFYLENNKVGAITQYEELVQAQPLNYVALNNLAWLKMEQGKHDEALGYSEKAYELAAKVPNVVDTYSQVLLKLDKKREALTKSKEAFELAKGKDVDITLNYIEILLANSRNNEAKTLLANISPVTDEQKNKTKLLLDRI